MATTRLSDILSQWQKWPFALSCEPIAIKQLSHNSLNRSYIIQSEESIFALRIESLLSAQLGVDRHREQTILTSAANAGLCPTVHYHCPENAYSVFTYLSGRNWTARDLTQPAQRKRLLSVIDQMQGLPCSFEFNYLHQLQQFFKQLQRLHCNPTLLQENAFLLFCEEFTPWFESAERGLLCHHDLWPENILETKQGLILLDWEYAGVGLKGFDQRFIESQLHGNSHLQRHGDMLDRLIYWLDHYWSLMSRLLIKRRNAC